jgi:indolepyruvate ferredoxin oxidoreductase alpha subunit
MLGNEAVARGAWEAGCTVAAAYPGTPSTEITEFIAKYDEIYCEWSPNEKVAMEVAIGAAIGGARSMCAQKHVGLNVAADPMFTVSYSGVNAGLVIVVADDPGMHSSQNEQDSRHYARAAKIPMLEPADSEECIEYTKKAFDISEAYDTPVLMRLTTRIAHSQSVVEPGEKRAAALKEYRKDYEKFVMMPAQARKRHVLVEKRVEALKSCSDECGLNRIEWGDKSVGIIAGGIAYQYAREALPRASFLKIGMVYPLPEKLIKEFAAGVEKLYVVEELDPFIEDAVKRLGIKANGKECFPMVGELTARLIRQKALGTSTPKTELFPDVRIPARPPVLCPGCPHRGVFYVLHKLRATVCGDIGCYTLGALPPLESIDTVICMGASIGGVHGMEKARGTDTALHTVAVLGESTFIHSGITGLIDIAYNKGSSTVIILDNSITGMTGHQQNPTTGLTIKGEPAKQVSLEKLCAAVGIERVRVEDPFNLKEFEQIVKEELQAGEPSVIIARRPCALLKHVRHESPLRIDAEKCKKCRRCLSLGCPAIVDTGEQLYIDESLCNGCGLCTKVCGFGAIERAGGGDE